MPAEYRVVGSWKTDKEGERYVAEAVGHDGSVLTATTVRVPLFEGTNLRQGIGAEATRGAIESSAHTSTVS